jgi:Holliday junction resolvasome RuvABC endonuclease subunit
MQLESLNWLQHKELTQEWKGMKIRHAMCEKPFPMCENAVGIDPGSRNWGMGIVTEGVLSAYWGTLPKQEHSHQVFDYIYEFITNWFPPKHTSKVCCVEGASYSDHFGQINLEDARLAFVQGFKALGKEVILVPPQTARKIVMGSGRVRASEVWLNINGNGADACCLALYGGGYKHEG